jgi:hypothetical protein
MIGGLTGGCLGTLPPAVFADDAAPIVVAPADAAQETGNFRKMIRGRRENSGTQSARRVSAL